MTNFVGFGLDPIPDCTLLHKFRNTIGYGLA